MTKWEFMPEQELDFGGEWEPLPEWEFNPGGEWELLPDFEFDPGVFLGDLDEWRESDGQFVSWDLYDWSFADWLLTGC